MFAGKVVLVTGSSQGIGAAAAVYFAKKGASVVVTGRNVEKLNDVAKQCEEVSNKKHLVVAGDIGDEKFPKTLLDATIKQFKKLDVLVNNAGVYSPGGIEQVDISLKAYERIFKVNLEAVYRLTKLAIPYLIETKGNVVNISSTAGIRPFPGGLDYCMSKAALEQFTRCLALELAAKDVRVNVVDPGPVRTKFNQNNGVTDEAVDKMYEFFNTKVPMKRICEPEEVAPAIAFLASDGAKYITGVSFPVNGGFALCMR